MVLINPFALSHITYKNKVAFPGSPGIYYVLNLTKNEIIYIGQSKNIRARWNGHHRDWDIGMFQAIYETSRIVIAWELCDRNQLNDLEKRRIKELNPILNGKNFDDTESSLFGKENLYDTPAYYRYLINDPGQEFIDSIPEQEFSYLKAKAKLIELFNYRHSYNNRFIPCYRFFEKDCLITYSVNVNKDPFFSEYTNKIYEIVNDDLRTVIDYHVKLLEISWKFESLGWSGMSVVHALALLFGHLVEAGIKAIDTIVPVKDFHGFFLEQVEDPSIKATFLSLLRPIYRKVARRNWETIYLTAVVDLDGRLHDASTPDEPCEE
jgi:predicted GIY-YIG superfamily endonuclease